MKNKPIGELIDIMLMDYDNSMFLQELADIVGVANELRKINATDASFTVERSYAAFIINLDDNLLRIELYSPADNVNPISHYDYDLSTLFTFEKHSDWNDMFNHVMGILESEWNQDRLKGEKK